MRILTHNMLMCNVKKCSMQGYPLKIVPQNVETVESDFNPEFMQHMLPKLNWEGILSAANDVRACDAIDVRRKTMPCSESEPLMWGGPVGI